MRLVCYLCDGRDILLTKKLFFSLCFGVLGEKSSFSANLFLKLQYNLLVCCCAVILLNVHSKSSTLKNSFDILIKRVTIIEMLTKIIYRKTFVSLPTSAVFFCFVPKVIVKTKL